MTDLILWVSVGWLPIFLYFTMANETKFKKNIAVGVSLPFDAREDPQVTALLASFKKQLRLCCMGLMAAIVPCLFVSGLGMKITVWCIWIDLCIVLPNIPYALCNRALKEHKRQMGWQQSQPQELRVDLKAVQEQKALPVALFVPAVVMCLAPLLWQRSLLPVCLANGVSVMVLWGVYRYCYRNRAEMVDENTARTQALTRLRRRNWNWMWLLSAYGLGVLSLGMGLWQEHPTLMVAVILAVAAVLCLGMIALEFRTRRAQEKLTRDSGKEWFVDEDDKWPWGLVYYNPNDNRLIVNNRVGMNTTLNLAKRSGKVLAALLVALLLALPFTGVWLDEMERSPITLALEQDTVVSAWGREEYRIPVEGIQRLELLEELPQGLIRSWGTGMERVYSGDFVSSKYGSLKVHLDPTQGPYLLIVTQGGSKYLVGCREPGSTEAVYAALQQNDG